MFVHHITYRHRDGECEEFAGYGLTPSAALQNAVDTARFALAERDRGPFSLARIDAHPVPGAARARRNAAISGRAYLRAVR